MGRNSSGVRGGHPQEFRGAINKVLQYYNQETNVRKQSLREYINSTDFENALKNPRNLNNLKGNLEKAQKAKRVDDYLKETIRKVQSGDLKESVFDLNSGLFKQIIGRYAEEEARRRLSPHIKKRLKQLGY